MASFEARIEGMTQIAIEETNSIPTQGQVTQFLDEGIKDFTNKIIDIKPEEAFKFTSESEAANDNGITVVGKILSVVREHDSTSILRSCSPIDAGLRYEVTDVSSLHYRSKYNPGYFVLDKKIYVRPAAGGSHNDMKVSQIVYATTNFNQDAISNFPDEYEELIPLYAASKACQAAASGIQNNMPSKPMFIENTPVKPKPLEDIVLSRKIAELPDYPVFMPPIFDVSFESFEIAVNKEDFDMAEQRMKKIEKQIEHFDKRLDIAQKKYENSITKFESDLDRTIKNTDRISAIEAGEYKSKLEKYASDVGQYANEVGEYNGRVGKYNSDISKYTQELQEKTTKYNWYMAQSVALMNQYNSSIIGTPPQQEAQRGE